MDIMQSLPRCKMVLHMPLLGRVAPPTSLEQVFLPQTSSSRQLGCIELSSGSHSISKDSFNRASSVDCSPIANFEPTLQDSSSMPCTPFKCSA